ncbi:flagellar hook-associated family protein [Rhizobium sp. CG5]|uniref:flagellar hook-associated family protein n=1 Tax=Rhizobium sp. CG5 TaxID=2726076 RepID=UPI0020337909|nr:flagellar hook-associated family protein [Rhizobium sp. CG5]MCM2472828.1 flagellar hook-associated family protein [Rhizobium sp. CG5]
MKTSNVSNLAIQNAMRLTIQQSQNQLIDAQTEVTTGKYADVGAELGADTAVALDLNRDVLRLQSLIDTNSIVEQRLEASEEAMNQMATSGQNMMDSLVSLSGSQDATSLAVATRSIRDALDTFTSMANTSVNGEYLFSGINTDVQPLDNYLDPASPAKAAFDTEFQSYFGFTQSDSATSGITATQMEDFLTNVVEPMFSGSDWTTNWSSATDESMTSRISKTEVVETSTSINADGMRNFAMAAVVSLELLGMDLQGDVRKVVSDKAIGYTGIAVTGINEERTQMGLSQDRVTRANESLAVQKDIIDTHLSDIVGVDAYEASTRVNNLLSLVEASYTLTSRIQQLSLVNFL